VRGRAAAPNEYQAYDPWGESADPQNATAFRQNDSDPFRSTVTDEAKVDDEIRYLLGLLRG
jgi:hypothetical protein